MSSFKQPVYFDLLAATPVPLVVQQRVLKWGTAHGDAALLARLAAIDGLDQDIEDELASSPHLDVLLAWANRPGRSSDALVQRLAKEKRATLLVSIAERKGLDQDLYKKLAEHKSVTVKWALLGNTDVDHATRVSLANDVAKTYTKDNNGVRHQLLAALEHDLELWEPFIREARSNHLIATALTIDLTPELLDHVVDYVCRSIERNGSYELSQIVTSLANRVDLTPAQTARMITTIDKYLEAHPSTNGYMNWERRSLAEAGTRLKSRPVDGIESLFTAISEADSEESYLEAVRAFKSVTASLNLDRGRIAMLIIDHQHVTAELLHEHLSYYPRPMHINLAKRFENEGRLEHIVRVALHSYVFDSILESLENPRPVVDHLLNVAFRDGNHEYTRVADFWFDHAVKADQLERYGDIILEHIPARRLLTNAACTVRVMPLIESRLGDNDRRWETFDSLISEYTGSLNSLLDTVDHLTV